MTTKTVRKIVKIDEDKCDGCGACAIACAEGALQIIDGKARLISEKYCDGLGACLGECPQGAITVEERTSDEFDEEATRLHLQKTEAKPLPCGCPGSRVTRFETEPEGPGEPETAAAGPSMLRHWPVQLTLVPPGAPFLQQTDLLLAADCVPFAYPGFHSELLKGHSLLIACPKLDDFGAHLEKLTAIFRQSEINSVTVARMEVPCCAGLAHMARQAIKLSGKDIPFREIIIGVRGDRLC